MTHFNRMRQLGRLAHLSIRSRCRQSQWSMPGLSGTRTHTIASVSVLCGIVPCMPHHPAALSSRLKLGEQMFVRLGYHMPNTRPERLIQIVDYEIDDIGEQRDAEGE